MILAILLGTLALGDPRPDLQRVHPARLLVEPVHGADAAAVARLHSQLGARVLADLPEIGWQVVEVDPARLSELREAYALHPLVSRAEFDRARRLAHIPNDPMWPGMWNLMHIHADTAWDTTRGASSVKIAVIDTGLETSHPDLAANVWVNPGEIPNNGIDDDGNGYVDDVRGWDFVNNDPIPDDVLGHGTACAGIIAAVQDNSLGITGIAPLCKLVPLKACNDAGYLYDSYVVPALLYAANQGCKVISMSFFGDQVTPAERSAIDYCWSHGALPVAAAGNSAQCFPYYPGAYEHTLAVGAHDSSDLRSWFSNYGSWVDVAAPGQGISATTTGGGYTTGFAGTSAATPHVAGIAALLFSAVPSATNDQVRTALEDSSIPTIQPGIGEWTNYGRVDARAALDRALGLTSGSKPPRFLFASPVGGGLAPLRTNETPVRPDLLLYGVGLEAPNLVRVLRNGRALSILSQSRNEVHTRLGSNFQSTIDLEVNGQIVQSLVWEGGSGWLFAPSDANTFDPAVSSGGFRELYRDDGARFTCTRDPPNARIFAQFSLRKVRGSPIHGMRLEWTRSYAGCTGGVETIELYDWQSASYPYGNFVTVATTPITGTSEQHLSVPLPANPARFLDDEGTAYVQLRATNAGATALLSMDSLRLRVY